MALLQSRDWKEVEILYLNEKECIYVAESRGKMRRHVLQHWWRTQATIEDQGFEQSRRKRCGPKSTRARSQHSRLAAQWMLPG